MATQHITEPDKKNPIYYWNNSYNSSLVHKRIFEDAAKSYQYGLDRQNTIFNKYMVYHMSDLKKDSSFCYIHKLPQTAYMLGLEIHPLLYTHFTKEDFLFHTGYATRLTLDDLLSNQISSSMVMVRIGGYFMPKVEIVEFPQATFLLIVPDVTAPQNVLDILIKQNAAIEIIITPKTDFYILNATISTIFMPGSANISFANKAAIALSNTHYDYNVTKDYDVYLIAHHTTKDLYIRVHGVMRTGLDGEKYLEIAPAFRSYFISSCMSNNSPFYINDDPNSIVEPSPSSSVSQISFSVYIVQKFLPLRTNILEKGESNEIQLEVIPVGDVPTVPNRIHFYKYHTDRAVLGDLIDVPVTQKYPYYYTADITNVPKGTYITQAECIPYSFSPIHFDDILGSYLNWNNDAYEEALATGTALEPFTSYKPLEDFVYDYNDYIDHKFFNDLRGYEIKKLNEIDFCAPRYFNEYLRTQYDNVKLFTKSVLRDDLLEHVISRKEQNTLFYDDNINTVVAFPKEYNYIVHASNNNDDLFVELYIAGKRIFIEFQAPYSHELYVFFDGDEIEDIKEICTVVCKWPKSSDVEIEFTFNAKDEAIPFPESEIMGDVTIGDLIYVDVYTGEYIDKSDIQYSLSVGESTFDEPHVDNDMPGSVPSSYFLTHDVEYYSTALGERITLKEYHTLVDPPICVDEEGNEVAYEYTSSKKVFDSADLEISTNNEKNVNKDILVTNGNNGKTAIIRDLATDDDKMVGFSLFTQNPDPSRFRVYHNGLLLSKDQYRYEQPTTYRGNAFFYFDNFDSGQIIVDYIPYIEEFIMDGMIPQSNAFKYIEEPPMENTASSCGLMIDTASLTGVDYPVHAKQFKIWVDGLFIAPNKIHNTPALGILFVETGMLEDPETHRVTIYIDKMDDDCFEYKTMLEKDPMRAFILEGDSMQYLQDSFIRDSIVKYF